MSDDENQGSSHQATNGLSENGIAEDITSMSQIELIKTFIRQQQATTEAQTDVF